MQRKIRPARESLFLALRKLFTQSARIIGLGWARVYAKQDLNSFTIHIPSEERSVFLFRPREEGKFVIFDDKSGELDNGEIKALYRRVVESVSKANRPPG